MEGKKILFVEDDKVDRLAFERFAGKGDFPYDYSMAGSVKEAAQILVSEKFDAVVLDYMLGDGTAFDLFDKTGGAPIIIVTGTNDQKIAVEAMKSGAYDFLIKDHKGYHLNVLPVSIKNAISRKRDEEELKKHRQQLENLVGKRTGELKTANEILKHEVTERKQAEKALKNALTEVARLKDRLQAENIYLQDEIKIEHNFEQIISKSIGLKKALRKVRQVASIKTTVLVLGETGTGKELFARAIHNISNRNNRPLVKVDCAALPPHLIENELFGHERGAFTGAHIRKIGRFELADGGVIFLDEIGDMPPELQTKLLRFLQDGEFERLGSSETIKVDVRVIAATNRNLKKNVEEGIFREDLYFRLNVFPIDIPPLRNRKDDIPLLVKHFVKKYNAKLGKRVHIIPLKVLDSLKTYHWPGNVRELENIIERAVILTHGPALELDELFALLSSPLQKSEKSLSLKDAERSLIVKALEESKWIIEGKRGATTLLEIAPSTLRDRMKKYGIKKHDYKRSKFKV